MQKADSRKDSIITDARPAACLLPSCLLLSAFCFLPSAYCFAQPGVPPLNSPLYGARTKSGSVSTGLPPVLKEVGIDQRLNEQVPLDAVFKDDQGREVRLGEYFKGKPVVLALVYYSCPMLCNQILIGTLTSVRQVSFNAGEEYQIVAISFDSRETPQLAAAKKQTYVKAYNRASGNAGWHFLTGDDANIKRVTDAVGFRYKWDEKTNQFAHASGIFVTNAGRKTRALFLWHRVSASLDAARAGRSFAESHRHARRYADVVLLSLRPGDRKVRRVRDEWHEGRRRDHGWIDRRNVVEVAKAKWLSVRNERRWTSEFSVTL